MAARWEPFSTRSSGPSSKGGKKRLASGRKEGTQRRLRKLTPMDSLTLESREREPHGWLEREADTGEGDAKKKKKSQ